MIKFFNGDKVNKKMALIQSGYRQVFKPASGKNLFRSVSSEYFFS
jgi:hypothetical protein